MITDDELAEGCCPGGPAEEKQAFLDALTPEKREVLKRLIWTGNELNAGHVPPGVMI